MSHYRIHVPKIFRIKNAAILLEKLTESALMTREGGKKSSFSPFLMFLRATNPLSPTSTLSIPIFWGGRPESDNHFCSKAAFSNESTSQPQGIFWVTAVLMVSVLDIEHRIGCLRGMGWKWRDGVWKREGGRVSVRAVWNILEVSAMDDTGERESYRNLICWRLKPYVSGCEVTICFFFFFAQLV